MEKPKSGFSNKSTVDNNITNQSISGNTTNDVQQLKIIFDKTFDVVYREFEIGGSKKGMLIFIDGLVNTELIDSDVLKPLLNYGKTAAQLENI
ncbi:spore germination protein [Clostridium sp. DJ247]|uniref:spore germination protein n=1 Tax=Clostridium sp. DJ247 TaxID=2726188 RepID=UPI0016247A46|nr:spore germination protein [Clostridium sp. DJ247]MBC2579448.1 spore germination protein [Clostridium sp. DJ247]